MKRSRSVRILLLAAPIAALLGCGSSGPSLGEVTGTITKNGKPLTGVMVQFTPIAGGRASNGGTDGNGAYELFYTLDKKGALVGKHSVTFAKNYGNETVGGKPVTPELPPAQEVEVSSSSNTFDFEVK
jgi:hypothetical protein